ncbi:serine hydrolase domain-containing protein [Micromonospora polyrhachis]|uniref:D-alanyl-D-alanine carboxypeptidase n=1 Tax=Micromonospora polyrhachis TaxID=1282883 RepID=A0A7W7WP82_9ACTN|nr:serine hydrolase domain-containing protein [Micromonospora polyrhachis]MBB4958399.1 D-alanyl-D-alanine carboxypeptidase [Micromonospora polyrhachis]
MKTPRRALAVLAATTVASVGLAAPAVAGPKGRCSTEPTAPTTLPRLSAEKLSAAIANLPNDEVTGALVQIRGSAGCWQGTSGVADLRTGRPVPQDGRFRIGSMTKTFTAVVALQLVADGELDLDRSVQHYLPGYLPADYPTITVRQVLTYTSGINGKGVPHKDPDWFFAHRYDHWEPGSQLDLTKPLAFPPGTKQRYGNADYILAGLLIEKVTGRSWEREVTNRIIRPLGLTGTTAPSDDRRIHGPHARGYEAVETAEGTRWVDITEANPSLQWSAASIVSTAADLDKFIVELFSGRLVPAAQLELMFSVPAVPVYDGDDDPTNDQPATHSAGLMAIPLGPLTLWGKSGDRPGYNNGMGATKDLSRRLVYSVNTIHMGGEMPAAAQRIIGASFS